jgi:hypothetical protein
VCKVRLAHKVRKDLMASMVWMVHKARKAILASLAHKGYRVLLVHRAQPERQARKEHKV